jgi:hypothetical protein
MCIMHASLFLVFQAWGESGEGPRTRLRWEIRLRVVLPLQVCLSLSDPFKSLLFRVFSYSNTHTLWFLFCV